MPVISARGNFAGLDTRRGFADSSMNSCSDMRNIQLREKSIKKRLGHQKLHDDAAGGSSLRWVDLNEGLILAVRVGDYQIADLTSASGWSFEFAFRVSRLPTGGTTRKLLRGPINARLDSAGNILVGGDAGGGAVLLTSATVITLDTDFFVSVTYDPSGAGTLILYLDGVSDATDAAYGTPFTPSPTLDLQIGDRGGLTQGGTLRISELRIWDDTRTPAEVAAFDGQQLTSAVVATDTDLVHYWRFDEGSGDIAEDLGTSGEDILVCYDPVVPGLIEGSSIALRYVNNISLPASSSPPSVAQFGATVTQVTTTPIGYYRDGNDQTWQFAVRFDQIPTDTAAWTYTIVPLFGTLTEGLTFTLDSPGASTTHRFGIRYQDGNPADDINFFHTLTIVIGRVYGISITCDLTGVPDRTLEMFVDGVSVGTAGPTAETGGSTASTAGRIVGFTDDVPVAAGVNDRVDFVVDDIKLWRSVKSATFIANTDKRALFDAELDDTELDGYWKLEDARSVRNLSSIIDSAENTTDWEAPPDGQANVSTCPDWSFSLVTPEEPCITGIHNYLNGNRSLNEVVVHVPGSSNKINETTSLLEVLTPYSPQGNNAVDSLRFGRNFSRSYYANGQTAPWRYDGEDVHRTGIEAIALTPRFVTSVGGVGWPVGDYFMAASYLAKAPDGIEYESALSPSVEFTLGVAAVSISFNNIPPSNDPQVTHIQTYVTKTDGTVLFKSQVFANDGHGTSSNLVITQVEADLIIAEEPNHNSPLNFRYMVERDGRMIWAGDPDNERLIFFSEVDFPEYVGLLNSIEHFEEVTALAVGANNELVIFGRTGRRLLLGDISNVLTPVRDFRNGGCLSHGSLENIEGWIYGLGVDGPFRTNAQTYQTVDEIFASGRVSGSIRQQLEDETDKTEWDRAQSSYDLDRKTWYLTIPASDFSTTNAYRVYPLQWDIPAWTRYTDWACDGVVARRRDADESFHKTLGSALRGFVCEIEEEGFKDGLANAEAHSFTVLSVDTAADSVTLTATPTATGDGVKGLALFEFNSANNTISFIGNVTFQSGATLFLDADPAALVATDIVFLGVYESLYQTKSIDARTTTRRKKNFRWVDVDQNEETTGSLLFRFFRIDDTVNDFRSNAKDASLDQSQSRDLRFGMNIGTERMIMQIGTVEPNPMEVFGYDLNYEQMGVT